MINGVINGRILIEQRIPKSKRITKTRIELKSKTKQGMPGQDVTADS